MGVRNGGERERGTFTDRDRVRQRREEGKRGREGSREVEKEKAARTR